MIGSRYTPGGDLGEWNPVRKLLSAAAVWVTWPMQRTGCAPRTPCRASSWCAATAWSDIAFQQSGFKLLLEILVRARISSVREVPFAFGLRYRGASKANMKVAMDYGRLLARLYRGRFGFAPRAFRSASFD